MKISKKEVVDGETIRCTADPSGSLHHEKYNVAVVHSQALILYICIPVLNLGSQLVGSAISGLGCNTGVRRRSSLTSGRDPVLSAEPGFWKPKGPVSGNPDAPTRW
jgi:hypothetical protein